MKLIHCASCGDAVALSRRWRNCDCGESGGAYKRDLDTAIVAGPCQIVGVSNHVFYRVRAEAWPYDESNGKIERRDLNTGDFPDRRQRASDRSLVGAQPEEVSEGGALRQRAPETREGGNA